MKKIILLIHTLIILTIAGYSQTGFPTYSAGSVRFGNSGANVTKWSTNLKTGDSILDNAVPTAKAVNQRIRDLISGNLTGLFKRHIAPGKDSIFGSTPLGPMFLYIDTAGTSGGSSSNLGIAPTSTTLPFKDTASGSLVILPQATTSLAGVLSAHKSVTLDRGENLISHQELRAISTTPSTSTTYHILNSAGFLLNYKYNSTSSLPDDSVTAIAAPGGGKFELIYENYILANWWPLHADGVTDDSYYMQKAMNFARDNGKASVLRIMAGTYLVHNLLMYHKTGTEYDFVTYSIDGTTPTHSTNGPVVIFKNTDPSSFILGVVAGRNIEIGNITFQGPSPIPFGMQQIVEWKNTDWLAGGMRNNSQSPSCGINIDPFYTSVTSPNQYPGLAGFYTNSLARATSQVTMNNCSWTNLVGAVVVGVNGFTQNCDNIKVNGGTQVGNKAFWISGQNQSRDNSIHNLYSLGQTQTFIDCNNYGSHQGTPPTLYDVSIAGGTKYLYQFNGPFAGFSMHGGHIESLYALGIGGDLPVNFYGTEVKLEVGVLGNRTTFTSPTVAEGNGPINFFGGSLEWFDEYLAEGWIFNTLGVNFNGTHVSGGVILNRTYNAGWTSFNGAYYKNAYGQNTLWQAKDIFNTDVSIYSTFFVIPGMKIKNQQFPFDNNTFTWESIDNQIETIVIESAAIKVDSTTHTGYFLAANPDLYQLSEDLTTLTAIDDTTDIFSANGYSHLGFTTAKSGDTVRLAYIPYGLVNNGTYQISISRIPKFYGRSIGDITNGSKNILHVQGTWFRGGGRIKGPGIPVGAYVTGFNGDTIKISTPAFATTTGIELRDAKMSQVSYAKYAGIYHQGDIIYEQIGYAGGSTQDTIYAEVCTKAGVFGGSPTPVFKQIKFGGSGGTGGTDSSDIGQAGVKISIAGTVRTFKVDSALYATRAALYTSIDSLAALVGGGGAATPVTIAPLDSGAAPSANGARIVGINRLVFQSVDATHPGLMNTTTQTISGNKIWNGNSAFASFSMGTLNFTVPGSEAFKVSGTLGNAATFGILLAGVNIFHDNDADGAEYFRSAGTAYYNMIIGHAGIQSLVGHTMAANLWLPGITTGVNTDSILVIHNSDVRKIPASALSSSGITITQLDSAMATLDTTYHGRTFQSISATTFNIDTIHLSGGTDETLIIDASIIARKTTGGSYYAKKQVMYQFVSGTLDAGTTPVASPSDTYSPDGLLSTYTFTITKVGLLIIIQCTSESGTINGTLEYRVKRQK